MWSSSSTGLTKWLSGQASWSSSFWSSDGWSSAWWRWLSWSSLSNHPDLQVIDGKRTVWKGNVQQQPWVQFDLVVETFVSKVNQIFQFIFLYFHLLTVVIIIWIVLVFETFASKIFLPLPLVLTMTFLTSRLFSRPATVLCATPLMMLVSLLRWARWWRRWWWWWWW